MNSRLFSIGLIVYGSMIIGSHTKWQFGVAAFFISTGVATYIVGHLPQFKNP